MILIRGIKGEAYARKIEKGIVDFKLRNSTQSEEIKVDNIVEYVKNKKEELFYEINRSKK